jgi:hypothetical protein
MYLCLSIDKQTANEHGCFRTRHCEQESLFVAAGVHLRFPDRHCLHAFAVLIPGMCTQTKEKMTKFEDISRK